MTALPLWPALQPEPGKLAEPLPDALPIRRGIWGKVPGEASDYRWISRSANFADGCPDLAGALRIGAEDTPVTAPLWRRLPDRLCAVAVYPSRAIDSAGRLTVIEKQVCEWLISPDIPAALAALTLLPAIARRGDQDWWSQRDQGHWHRGDYALPIDPADCAPIPVDAATLPERIDNAITDLLQATTTEQLQSFYATLLSGQFPAALPTPAPLPPEALAALLLPLPRTWADRLSIAGGLADRRPSRYDLIRNWDVAVTSSALRDSPPFSAPDASDMAKTLVETLRELAEPDPVRES